MANPSMSVRGTSTSSGLDQNLEIQTTTPKDVDGPGALKETTWQSNMWTTYNAYYDEHISIRSVLIKLAMWTMGKGHTGSEEITSRVTGWGKETFDEVMANQIRIEHANGDSYAEIVTTDGKKLKKDASNFLNLKPLNPGSMVHIVNGGGVLERYEQNLSNGKVKKYKVEKIFHLCLNRTADEIHGTGDIAPLITFLDKIKQLDEDMSVMFHRFVVPLVIWSLNTDDPAAIAEFKTHEKAAWNTGDNLIVPDKAVGWELLEAGKGVGRTINPMEWRNKWVEEVIKGGGVPALIMAIESGTTEAASKMIVLGWGMVVENEQRKVEHQVKAQLHLEIKLPDPPKIDTAVAEDMAKEGNKNATDPKDTKAEVKGKK